MDLTSSGLTRPKLNLQTGRQMNQTTPTKVKVAPKCTQTDTGMTHHATKNTLDSSANPHAPLRFEYGANRK